MAVYPERLNEVKSKERVSNYTPCSMPSRMFLAKNTHIILTCSKTSRFEADPFEPARKGYTASRATPAPSEVAKAEI